MSQQIFKTHRPLSLRLWHWLNAFTVIGLLLTVLLRKTLLSWRTNSSLIATKLEASGTAISADVAKDIAISIRNPLWDWHIYLGYGLSFLILFRLITALITEKKFIFSSFFQKIKTNGPYKNLVEFSYLLFYVATLFMVISGLLLIFKNELSLEKPVSQLLKETHELMMWFFVAFTGIHLLGVIVAENRQDPGLISEMVNGGDHSQKP